MIHLPTWDLFMIPALRAMKDGQIRNRDQIYQAVADLMGLTSEQKLQTYEKSGGIAFHTRIGFGLSFLHNVGALDQPSRGIYRLTDAGRQVLEKFPQQATEKELRAWAEEEGSPIRPYVPRDSQSRRAPEPVNEESARKVSKKFGLAALFRERVLENNQSFLWPEDEAVWSVDNARRALDITKHLAGKSQESSTSELVKILREADRATYQVICDARAATVLKDLMPRDSAQRELSRLLAIKGPFNGDEATVNTLVESASETFPGSIDGRAGMAMIDHFLVILGGLIALLEGPESLGDRDSMTQRVLEQNAVKTSKLFPFWTLFYLMFPDQVASIPGHLVRERAISAFRHLLDGYDFPHFMAELAAIRVKLDPNFDPYTFDFFAEPWKSMWNHSGASFSKSEGETVDVPELDEQDVGSSISHLAAATHLDEQFLHDIETLLNDKKQLIFEGPPGSGKTFVAEKFARYITGQPLDGDRNEQVELIQFHQSYSYEDFVEGIRPRTNEAGQLIYDVEPGIFRAFAERSKANPDKKFVLIIDEINRGNVSRILGELMLLLEYRNQKATLPYSKQELRIPDNLYIISTMNSADRSLSQIDYALRRRFYFVRFMSVEHGQADVLRGWLQARDVPHTGPVALFVRLNERIREQMHTDDLQVGHSYFMRTDIGDPEVLDQVWKYSVMPLLREYFYHQKDREELLEGFELNRLSGIPDVPVTSPEANDGVIE